MENVKDKIEAVEDDIKGKESKLAGIKIKKAALDMFIEDAERNIKANKDYLETLKRNQADEIQKERINE